MNKRNIILLSQIIAVVVLFVLLWLDIIPMEWGTLLLLFILGFMNLGRSIAYKKDGKTSQASTALLIGVIAFLAAGYTVVTMVI